MKKITAAILIILTVLSVCSCAAQNTADTTSADTDAVTVTEQVTEAVTEDDSYIADLPSERFEGDFNILIEGSFWCPADTLYYEEASDDAVLDAVWQRQTQIQEQFGTNLILTPASDTTSVLRRSVKSGDAAYDAIITRMPLIATSASNETTLPLARKRIALSGRVPNPCAYTLPPTVNGLPSTDLQA